MAAGRRRTLAREVDGRIVFQRRSFLLLPGEGQRPVYDDYVIGHRVRAAQAAPELGFAIPTRGHPYPRSSVPPQLVALQVQAHLPERLEALEDALFSAVFVDLADVADPQVLARCATRADVPAELVEEALADPALRRRVEREHLEARLHGIDGIPALLFAGVPPIVGAVPLDLYRRAADHALDLAAHTNEGVAPPAPPDAE